MSEKEAWEQKAQNNVEKWGQQDAVPLLMAIAEELGELVDEVVPEECPEFNEDTIGDSWILLRRISTDGRAIRSCLEANYEDEDGQPVDDRPPMVQPRENMDPDDVQNELDDLGALLVQLQWALDKSDRQ